MAQEKVLKKRSEMDPAFMWHLEDLYENDRAWEEEYEDLSGKLSKLTAYEGRLSEGPETFLAYMKIKESFMKQFERIYVYANQRYHEDTGNAFYQQMSGKAQMLAVQVNSATTFEEPELLEIGRDKIDGWFQDEEAREEMEVYRRFFYELFRLQDHVLSKDKEDILTEAADVSSEIANAFSMFNNADLKFPSIKGKDGEEIPVSHGRYTLLLESRDRNIRREAFSSVQICLHPDALRIVVPPRRFSS